MINNDVLRSLRYLLKVDDAEMAAIAGLADGKVDTKSMKAFLLREDEAGYVACGDAVMAQFLNGLIIFKRGKKEGAPAQPVEKSITNNLILKKLRVAFELQDNDMHEVLRLAGFPVAKPELSALFRNPTHKNYRPCGDQLLRNFLKGLTLRAGAAS